MIELINQLSGIGIALILGIWAFRYMNAVYRIFFYQLLVFSIILAASYFVPSVSSAQYNNQWLYNLSMPLETFFLSWAAYEYFKFSKQKYLVGVGYCLFMAALLIEIYAKGFFVFSNHGYIAESVLLLLLYLLVLYNQLTKENNAWKRSPEVWISIGIVLYFGGVVPYLSFINYLQEIHSKVSHFLFRIIIEGLSNLRYLLLAAGFWLIRRNADARTTVVNE